MKKIIKLCLVVLLIAAVPVSGCARQSAKGETNKDNKWKEDKVVPPKKKRPEPVFSMREICEGDEVYQRIIGRSYKENDEIALENLRYLTISYYGFDEETHQGEMIVNKDVAQKVLAIFEKLYAARYPIERMELVDEFDADDTKSMEANNTSAFNYRKIANSNQLSNHSYGRAIDINPLYNPYVYQYNGKLYVEPEAGRTYADRSKEFPHKIQKNDFCYRIFTEYGFTWGGDFQKRKDYQHFEIGNP
ncbi:MAG: M15 family metallopeptidase [Lachnospiraceae bacterium]|nr:M15 family metallopeptidase [Lachnospiraceae bacterium]